MSSEAMDLDDPSIPEFRSWTSFHDYAYHVRHKQRFVWDELIQSFLDTVIATSIDRQFAIKKDRVFFRAQRGVEKHEEFDETTGASLGQIVLGYGKKRMKPRSNKAGQGRANSAGIPVLYVASQKTTAIAEVRPWVGSEISVARFKTLRDLKAVDLSHGHNKPWTSLLSFDQAFGSAPVPADLKSAVVWNHIDNAFSAPVTLSDEVADYVPTQILAERFKEEGYDAVVYRSQFGDKTNGFNLAVFDPEDAEPIDTVACEVTQLTVCHQEIGPVCVFKKESEDQSSN